MYDEEKTPGIFCTKFGQEAKASCPCSLFQKHPFAACGHYYYTVILKNRQEGPNDFEILQNIPVVCVIFFAESSILALNSKKGGQPYELQCQQVHRMHRFPVRTSLPERELLFSGSDRGGHPRG